MLAAQEDRPDVLRALLFHGTPVDAISRQMPHPSGHVACKCTNLLAVDREGKTALSMAALAGNINSVSELLRLGAFAGYLIAG